MTPRIHPKKSLLWALVVTALVLAALWLLVSRHLTLDEIQQIARRASAFTGEHYLLVFAALAGAHAVGMGFSLPTKALLSLLAGALLGIVGGSGATLIGVLSGTTILFFSSRHLLRERVARHLTGKTKQIERRISERPIRAMIGLRLFIVLPFGPLTITAALSSMRYRDFLIGTVIGDISVIVLYSLAGQKIFELTSASEVLSPSTVIVLIAVGSLFLFATLLGRKRRADERESLPIS